MADCIVLKGGGADLDVVTAGKSDVLSGKVIVDKNGEPSAGTMPNRGTVNQALNAGGSYTIPDGYHNGGGKVTANSLTSQTPGTATAAHILNGQTAWVNGNKIPGSMPNRGQAQYGANCAYVGDYFAINGIPEGAYYKNGADWAPEARISSTALRNVLGITANKIQKGQNIAGVVGTAEGYVPGSTDLYYRGNNVAGWENVSGWSFQAGQIYISGADNYADCYFNTVGRSYLNVEGSTYGYAGSSEQSLLLMAYINSSWTDVGRVAWYEHGYYVKSINIVNVQMNVKFRLKGRFTQDTIFRIWLS